MNLLALDLGTRTGWALAAGGGRVEHGVQVFDVRRGESPGMRYLRFNRWLDELTDPLHGLPTTPVHALRHEGPFVSPSRARLFQLIAYEQPHHRGGAATEVANGFATRVQEFCARHNLQHAAVHTATLKKWATGKGNADKAAMVVAVSNRWERVEDDNEADALALFYYARATWGDR